MNHYEYHAKALARIAAKGDFEMAYHQALGTIKSLCNDFEDLQNRNRRYETHCVMGVPLHIKYTVEGAEKGHGISPDYPAELGQCRIWVVGQDTELKEGLLHDAAVEMIEAEVADDAVYA
jgi:hypothetical protein